MPANHLVAESAKRGEIRPESARAGIRKRKRGKRDGKSVPESAKRKIRFNCALRPFSEKGEEIPDGTEKTVERGVSVQMRTARRGRNGNGARGRGKIRENGNPGKGKKSVHTIQRSGEKPIPRNPERKRTKKKEWYDIYISLNLNTNIARVLPRYRSVEVPRYFSLKAQPRFRGSSAVCPKTDANPCACGVRAFSRGRESVPASGIPRLFRGKMM